MADSPHPRHLPAAPVVLAVDDEPQALKYLPEVLGRPCLCAGSAAEARLLVERDPAAIAVVLCDQRMPGETGVEFLAWLRHHHPGCVRILCTAYADIDAAIAAVNDGAVFQFVLKPWQPQVLRSLINAAVEHHTLQRDRDRLVNERLELLQRQVAADRIHHLATTAAALAGRLRHPLIALRTFLSHCPTVPPGDREDGHVQWGDLWELAQRDCQRTLLVLDGMVDVTALPPVHFVPGIVIREVVASAFAACPGCDAGLDDAGNWPQISGDAGLLQRLFTVLASRLADPRINSGRLRVTCEPALLRGAVPGIRIQVHVTGAPWSRSQLLAFLGGTAAAIDPAENPGMLVAYVIAFHHGGSIVLPGTSGAGSGLAIELPLDPVELPIADPDPGWVRRLVALPVA